MIPDFTPHPHLVDDIRMALFPDMANVDDLDYHRRYITAILMLRDCLEWARDQVNRD